MNKMELEIKRDEIIREMRDLKERLNFIDAEIKGIETSVSNKPEIVYNNYKSW